LTRTARIENIVPLRFDAVRRTINTRVTIVDLV
jgi:hypothetical protein